MVGGKVIETIRLPKRVWVNCQDKYKCAIYVESNEKSRRINIGDSVWWQSGWAFWTPVQNKYLSEPHRGGIDYDIRIPRIGFSGVSRPSWIQCVWQRFLTLIPNWA